MGLRLSAPGITPEEYKKGLLWTSLGVLCLTPDSLLVRLIEVEPWTLLFWRGLLMALGFSLFLGVKKLSPRQLSAKGWLAALFLALSTTCFVFSLENTQAANTLVIIATSPLIAAFLSWILLGELVSLSTWLAIAVATSGVAISMSEGYSQGNLLGELFALGSAVSMACHFTALRWWKSDKGPLAVWGAGLLTAAIAWPKAHPTQFPTEDVVWMILLGAVVLPVAFGLMAVGPRYLPAPEVGLLLLAETVLGPLWVWLALSERPSQLTLVGGAVVITTLVAHSLHSRVRPPENP